MRSTGRLGLLFVVRGLLCGGNRLFNFSFFDSITPCNFLLPCNYRSPCVTYDCYQSGLVRILEPLKPADSPCMHEYSHSFDMQVQVTCTTNYQRKKQKRIKRKQKKKATGPCVSHHRDYNHRTRFGSIGIG